MNEELDRRIAVEVMGERVLPKLDDRELDEDLWPTYSPGGNWWCTLETDWTPLPFSTDLDLALRAVAKHRLHCEHHRLQFLNLMEDPNSEEHKWGAFFSDEEGYGTERFGSTLPEAICHLLLALVEGGKE